MLRKLSTRSFRFAAASFALSGALVALAPSEASAQYYNYRRGSNAGAVAAGVVGGLALGALAVGAARPYYYGPAPAYVFEEQYPPPPPPRCWYEREDVWNGYGYTPRRIRVCH